MIFIDSREKRSIVPSELEKLKVPIIFSQLAVGDYVVCEICNNHQKEINHQHLRKHHMTCEEYKKLFPNAKLIGNIAHENMTKADKGRKKHTKEEREKISKGTRQHYIEHPAPKGANHWLYGRHHSEETKRKIRLRRLGKKHTEETKEKISRTLKRLALYVGDKSPYWKGGERIYPPEFNKRRKEVTRERDGNICNLCLEETKDLVVHRIDYNKSNNKFSNLITLCRPCHAEANFNRDIWEKKFKEMLWLGIR